MQAEMVDTEGKNGKKGQERLAMVLEQRFINVIVDEKFEEEPPAIIEPHALVLIKKYEF